MNKDIINMYSSESSLLKQHQDSYKVGTAYASESNLIKIQDGKGQAAYENINENVKIKIVGDAF